MTFKRWPSALVVGGLLVAASAFAQGAASENPGSIAVDNVWSRAAVTGQTAAVYLTITDNGAPDQLVSVSTPIAKEASVHQSFAENNVMKMRPAGALTVAPGQPLTLAPGGYHVMLMGLTRATTAGDSFPLTLTFRDSPAKTVAVRVQGVGRATSGMDMPGMAGPSGAMAQHGP
jgi:periplasmic copper chaperone A